MFTRFAFVIFLGLDSIARASEWSGDMSLQWRHFMHDPASSLQHNDYASLAIEPEWHHSWNEDNQSLTFVAFARADQYDDERTHGDIRELLWRNTFDTWQIKAGIGKVFWGVAESQHLVDVINQTDFVENLDGEDKLGQPMIQLGMERDWGKLDIFVLPGFRERTFSSHEGRPYLAIHPDAARYESEDEQQHIDYALRLFNSIGDWEIGLSYFDGTSREPLIDPANVDIASSTIIPFYSQMQQFGLDAQATTEDWLWKLEIIHRSWLAQDFNAATAGFEYTFVGIFETSSDIGWVMEYLYDDRDEQATGFFQNDVMMGLRLTLNDEPSTEALFGVIYDLDNQENLVSLEASRRLGSNWKLSVEARLFNNIDGNSLLYSIRNDDVIQMDLAYYF
jgi:hypothetical protein